MTDETVERIVAAMKSEEYESSESSSAAPHAQAGDSSPLRVSDVTAGITPFECPACHEEGPNGHYDGRKVCQAIAGTATDGCTPGQSCDLETGRRCHRHWAEKAIPGAEPRAGSAATSRERDAGSARELLPPPERVGAPSSGSTHPTGDEVANGFIDLAGRAAAIFQRWKPGGHHPLAQAVEAWMNTYDALFDGPAGSAPSRRESDRG